MAHYPPAHWLPVGGLQNDPPITPVGVILHVSGSEAASLRGWFDGPSGGIESHLHIAKDGTIEQYRDTEREADANYRGNSWIEGGKRLGFLSVETQGTADGVWTPEQVTEIKRFLTWASRLHNFPLRVAPGYRSPGVGYHVMWGAGEGTASWSNAAGKVCPGPARIRQFHNDITPWMSATKRAALQEDDMTPEQSRKLDETAAKVDETAEKVDDLHRLLTGIGSLTQSKKGKRVLHGAGYYLATTARDVAAIARDVADLKRSK